MGHQHIENVEETFTFPAKLKRYVFILIATGLAMFVLGLIQAMTDTGHHGDGHGGHHAVTDPQSSDLLVFHGDDEELLAQHGGGHDDSGHQEGGHGHDGDAGHNDGHGHAAQDVHGDAGHASEHAASGHDDGHGAGDAVWLKRLKVTLWHNSIFILGLSVIGIFFVAIQYVSTSGWSVQVKRVSEAISTFIPYAGVLLIITYFLSSDLLFHWTHTGHGLYDPTDPHYDPIIAGKKGMFFYPFVEVPTIPYFFLLRMFMVITVWTAFAYFIRKEGYREDANGGVKHYRRSVMKSGLFLVFFGLTVSMVSWDWIMSIDTHWFSTMFGWYMFASWFVAGLSTITLACIYLKEFGFLKHFNENHFHDLGKYIFAFSIFWTYVWFSQFLLIYYANIPEETVYFWERLNADNYYPIIFVNLIMNFAFPFLGLMTRDAKRMVTILKIVCTVVISGHWIDFFLMIAPGTLKEHGTIGLMELGLGITLFGAMAYVAFNQMSRVPLIQKNHPMLEESLHHHI